MDPATLAASDCFDRLTETQKETLRLVGEGLTTKEIAHHLGISMSGASKRIEILREKFGGVTKAQLGRIFRAHTEGDDTDHCIKSTGDFSAVPASVFFERENSSNDTGSQLLLQDSLTLDGRSPWAANPEPDVVPEELDGKNASANRWMAVVGIALGMAVLMLVMLAVANSIERIAW